MNAIDLIVRTRIGLGHLDTLVIADAGLPIPDGTMRIDLALTQGVPGAVQTLRDVLDEMQVEKVILAEEVKEHNPGFLAEVQGTAARRLRRVRGPYRVQDLDCLCPRGRAHRRICSLCQRDPGLRGGFLGINKIVYQTVYISRDVKACQSVSRHPVIVLHCSWTHPCSSCAIQVISVDIHPGAAFFTAPAGGFSSPAEAA